MQPWRVREVVRFLRSSPASRFGLRSAATVRLVPPPGVVVVRASRLSLIVKHVETAM